MPKGKTLAQVFAEEAEDAELKEARAVFVITEMLRLLNDPVIQDQIIERVREQLRAEEDMIKEMNDRGWSDEPDEPTQSRSFLSDFRDEQLAYTRSHEQQAVYEPCRKRKRGQTPEQRRIEYDAYLQTGWWKQRRLQRIITAGHRCEFENVGKRCTTVNNVQVHHLNYQRLYKELDEDLEVLCNLHHAVREIMKLRCYCGGRLFETVAEAVTFVRVRFGPVPSVSTVVAAMKGKACDHCVKEHQ